MKDLRVFDGYRQLDAEEAVFGCVGGETFGFFHFRRNSVGPQLRVMATNGDGWDHVSVSLGTRCPTWDEMEYVKRLFFRPDETAMQLHVPTSDHINCHPFCLHLWRPHALEIPRPPASMVGPVEEPAA